MGFMIPEVLYIICSYLEIDDVRNFRLCCRAFADAAACFVHRQIIFYPHEHDLEMLRQISLHPIASRNVHSLLYIGHTLGPKESIDEYRKNYATCRKTEKFRIIRGKKPLPLPQYLTDDELLEYYKKYEHALEQEERLLRNNEDISCIKEAVSRFTALQEVVMSCSCEFYSGVVKTPFTELFIRPSSNLEPSGCRQLNSVLDAVFESNIKLKNLSAGALSWQVFQKPATELKRTMSLFSDLTCLELCIDVGIEEIYQGPGIMWEYIEGTEVPQCRRLLKSGLLRDLIKSLAQLRTLQIGFNSHSEEHGYAASLEDIMEPKHTWEHLKSLTLWNITCERQDLMSMLKRHKNTLKELCLRSIHLESTSWRVLLPKIRETMNLNEACICFEMRGRRESPLYEEEYWYLSTPDDMQQPLRIEVNDYLVKDSPIDRCPLDRDNDVDESSVGSSEAG
ncbi:hypothetical protein F4805DRAFT_226073 [Annulohypoxylon moriforme]|nr:hypothetical protein F4805DRAFT_226073 [Annulohypoxylon moriforme]